MTAMEKKPIKLKCHVCGGERFKKVNQTRVCISCGAANTKIGRKLRSHGENANIGPRQKHFKSQPQNEGGKQEPIKDCDGVGHKYLCGSDYNLCLEICSNRLCPRRKKAGPPHKPMPATKAQIARARDEYQDENCEIDDDARVSEALDKSGVWVQAWVWLQKPEKQNPQMVELTHCPNPERQPHLKR